jgi:hypothetical protein
MSLSSGMGTRHAVLDGQVLHGLHVQRDVVHGGQLRLQAADDVGRAGGPFVERFEVDLDTAAVGGHVGAVNTDKRRQALHVRIFENHFGQRLLPV